MSGSSDAISNGDHCVVEAGAHAGKSGVVQDLHTSATGNVTITVVQEGGRRFKTLARKVLKVSGAGH
jgi:ribosomal protein S4E